MQLWSSCRTKGLEASVIGRITTDSELSSELRRDSILIGPAEESFSSEGFAAVLIPGEPTDVALRAPVAYSFANLDYLADGDIVSINPRGLIRTLYRRASAHNFILMTDQCNSFCLMCSQPPKPFDDHERINEHLRVIELMDPETLQLGITGGEPTLFGDDFLRLVNTCKDRLPKTGLHVLTNGRSFYYREFARRLGGLLHLHQRADHVHIRAVRNLELLVIRGGFRRILTRNNEFDGFN